MMDLAFKLKPMNLIFIISVVLCLSSCASTPTKTQIFRNPSAESFENILENHIQNLLTVVRKPTFKKYRAIRYPITTFDDIANIDYAYLAEINEYIRSEEIAQALELERQQKKQSAVKILYSANAFRQLSFADRADLLQNCLDGFRSRGDEAGGIFQSIFCEESPSLLITDEEFRNALLSVPASPRGVKYDGGLGFHRYTDKDLKLSIDIISVVANQDQLRFKKVYDQLSPGQKLIFQTENSDESEKSKVEPFDLIANSIVGMMLMEEMGTDLNTALPYNKIQLSKMVQKGLAMLLNLYGPQFDHITKTPVISVMRNKDKMTVFCVDGLYQTKDTQFLSDQNASEYWSKRGNSLVQRWHPFFNFREKGGAAVFYCNAQDYKFSFDRVDLEEIPSPAPFKTKGNTLNSLITISLVSEIDQSSVEMGRMFMTRFAGWSIVEDLVEVNTKDYFMKTFPKVDAYIPVMHSMDLNYFNIGSERSLVIKLSKMVPNIMGGESKVFLTVMFPKGGTNKAPFVMNPDELAQLMDLRATMNNSSLFLMNNSCDSEKTLPAWSLVFRRSLELRKKRIPEMSFTEITDFPYIIGSKRYFATDSALNIFSHAEYPLKSIEMLAGGYDVPQIVAYLKEPTSSGFISAIRGVFGSGKPIESEGQGFEPDYSGDYQELRRFGGFEVYLSGRGIKGKQSH